MAIKKYFIDPIAYQNKLKLVLTNRDECEYIGSYSTRSHPAEFYRILKTNASFVYDGRTLIKISAGTERTIDRTKTRLEKLSDGAKLTEWQNGNEHKGN